MDNKTDSNNIDNLFRFYSTVLDVGIGKLKHDYLSFYDEVINGNPEEEFLDHFALNGLPVDRNNYFTVVGKVESRRLFTEVWYTISTLKSSKEKLEYWKVAKNEIEFYILS
ncbi:MAG: hypothetical protein ABJA35_11765 [Parafilimonas sp.]